MTKVFVEHPLALPGSAYYTGYNLLITDPPPTSSTTKSEKKRKNPAYGRHQISRPMLIEAPIQKKNIQIFFFYFWGLNFTEYHYNKYMYLSG